jgi:hypothetical protein
MGIKPGRDLERAALPVPRSGIAPVMLLCLELLNFLPSHKNSPPTGAGCFISAGAQCIFTISSGGSCRKSTYFSSM